MYTVTFWGGILDGEIEYQNAAPKKNLYSSGANTIPLTEEEFANINQHNTRTMLYHKYIPIKIGKYQYQYKFDGFI